MTNDSERPLFEIWTAGDALTTAWARVRANKGMAGGDRVRIVDFEARADAEITRLSNDLTQGRYRPRRLFRIRKPKPSGGWRVIAIPSVRDRVAQTSCAMHLGRALEPTMSPASFAYRPGRSAEAAAGRLLTLRLQGWRWAFDADIATYFDTIPHWPLLEALQHSTSCDSTTQTIGTWLAHFTRRGIGIPQGSPVSPVLANLYLTPFDRIFNRGQCRLIRYADDFLVLARSKQSVERVRVRVEAELDRLGLAVNPAKSAIRRADDLAFLGIGFRGQAIQREAST